MIRKTRNQTGCWAGFLAMVCAALWMVGCASNNRVNGSFADVPGVATPPSAATAPADAALANPATAAATGPTNIWAGSSDIISVGDSLTIIFSDLPTPQTPFEERVKEDGTITLVQNQTFVAAGKTRGDLEREIRARYVPKYFRNLTVTVKALDRFYFVGGEVRMPGRQIYLGPMTVLKAIQSCGDFTDFAQKKKVQVTRTDGRREIVNCVKALENPALDLPIYPGDKIHVPRRFL